MGLDAYQQHVHSRRRRHVLHAGHGQSALRHGPQRGGTSSGHLRPVFQSKLERPLRGIGHECLRRAAADRLHLEPLRARQRLRPKHTSDAAVPLQRAARDRRQLGDRDRLSRLAQLPARAHVRSQRRDSGTGQRHSGQATVPGVHPRPDDRQRRRSDVTTR